ncbi:MAG: hypothetical protein ACOC1F_11210 [Myxococcota bacterium]
MIGRVGSSRLVILPVWTLVFAFVSALLALLVRDAWFFWLTGAAVCLGVSLLGVRVLSRRGATIEVRRIYTRHEVPVDSASLDINLRGASGGASFEVDLRTPVRPYRITLGGALTRQGALRVAEKVAVFLDLSTEGLGTGRELATRESRTYLVVLIPMLVFGLVGAGAFLYAFMQPATLHVVLEPPGQLLIDGEHVELSPSSVEPNAVVGSLELEAGAHQLRLRRAEGAPWTERRIQIEEHTYYQLFVDFQRGEGYLASEGDREDFSVRIGR